MCEPRAHGTDEDSQTRNSLNSFQSVAKLLMGPHEYAFGIETISFTV